MSLTSIITVNFHQPEVTIALLKSVKQFYTAQQVEVVIVDNGAPTNQEDLFKPYFDNIKYIQSVANLGFAGGNNLGFLQASGGYIFLLNNDTEVTEGCIETLIAALVENQNIGLISPLLLYYDNKELIQYAGFTPLNYLTGRNSYIGQFEKNDGQYADVTQQTAFCHGAAVMCRKTDLDKAGFMDESYFLYYEELDWCEKFKRIGKQIWFTGKTQIYHKESVSVGKASALKIYFNTRNRMLFIRKNTSLVNTILFSFYYTLVAIPKAIFKLLQTNNSHLIKWVLKGLFWNFCHTKNSKTLGIKIK